MDRPQRVRIAGAVVVIALALLVVQAATASGPATPRAVNGSYPGDTLIGVQSYGGFNSDNGKALVVDEDGDVVWEYAPEDARVFDVEALDNGNVLASVAERVPSEDCPGEYTDREHCVHNRVVELDYPGTEVVRVHDWYDAFIHWHEVHDADRLPSGETAIVDMGNDRALLVAENGTVTWEWQAEKHIGPGTEFWDEHVPDGEEEEYRKQGPESDWTHVNDIDHLENGNLQLSIRNFDVVVEVDRESKEIVDVVGEPGSHAIMNEQHNPNRLERHGTLIVADSENDRVVELDVETEEVVWRYDGTGSGETLRWPRDADRLPNGNTLVTDSLRYRVIEIDDEGDVVWSYSLRQQRGIVYEADRMGLPEEPEDVPSGHELSGRATRGPIGKATGWVEGYLPLLFPLWVGIPELVTGVLGLVAALWLAGEAVLARFG
jgi:hypothetical protein